jgi:hypothetical protein
MMPIISLLTRRSKLNNYINSLGHRHFYLDVRSNKVLGSIIGNHPMVLVGVIKPQELVEYNIYSNEDYYLFNQVSHKMGTHHDHMRSLSPGFEIVSNLNGYDICNCIIAVPGSIVKRDAQLYGIELSKLNQEQECINAILANLKQNSHIPGQLIWVKNGRIFKHNFDVNHLYVFKT